MGNQSHWTLQSIIGVSVFTAIALPFWIIWGPIYVIIRTFVTIWQPYIYKMQSDEWNKIYQDNLKQGIHIDYPPREGTILGIGPWIKGNN